MLKNKIYTYISKEIIKSFFIILFAFTSIAWTVRAVNFLDLIIENAYPIKTYLFYSLLNVTSIITKFIPLSFLLALIISIIKFQRQSELIILWTTGLEKMKLVNLFFQISIVVVLIQFCFSIIITPYSLNKSRTLVRTSGIDSISSIIKTNDFSDAFKKTTFFIEKRNSSSEMENIFIRDETNLFSNLASKNKDSLNTTIVAKKGYFDENNKLILYNGLIQTKKKGGKLDNFNFSKTELNLESLESRATTIPKIQETPTFFLINCIKFKNVNIEQGLFGCPEKQVVVENISRRIGMPFYIPVISLISSFLLIATRRNKNNFVRKYIYFVIGFLVLVIGEMLVRYTGFSNLNTLIYFLLPILFCPLLYFVLMNKFLYEKLKI